MHLFHQIRAFTLSKTHIFVIAHVCFTSSNLYFRLPLRVCFRICGRDKSAPTAADRLPITWRTIRKTPTNILPGIGDWFIVPVFLHNQKCIFTSSNTCFRFTAHAYPHYQLRVFTSLNTHIRLPLCGCFRICGRDKSAPTAADRLPITWRTIRKTPTNIPPGVGDRFIVPVSCIIKYVYSRH